jgi:hypothetical protein
MKRGIKFRPLDNPPVGPPKEVLGIPIVYAVDSKHAVADARGFGKRARIVVGPMWHRLDVRMQAAVLYHEAGHILGRHRELRAAMMILLCLPAFLLLPWVLLACIVSTLVVYFVIERWAQNQEIDADRFAARMGFGREMLHFVRSAGPPPMPPFFYPDYERRCGALIRELEGTQDEPAAQTARTL